MRIKDIKSRREEGFTLIELLITVVILGIIMAIAAPIYLNQKDKAASAAAKTEVAGIANIIKNGISTGSLVVNGSTNVSGVASLTGTLVTTTVAADSGSTQIGTAVVYVSTDANKVESFCVSEADPTSPTHFWFVNSSTGTVADTTGTAGCGVTAGAINAIS